MGRPAYMGYTTPLNYAPQWYVGNLVFQGGIPKAKQSSITGGGQMYGHEFTAMQDPNVIVTYSTPVVSQVSGGQMLSRPAFLQALLGGMFGNGS